jgi:GNAT superfamily N-acetyltransferase
VRPARRPDLHGIARCHADCWVEAYRLIVGDDYLARMCDLPARVERWRPRIEDPDSRLWVAADQESGLIAGEIWVGHGREPRRPDLPLWELRSLYLRRAWHGSGAADALIESGLGQRPAWLWVFQANTRAQRFYQRHGFAAGGEAKIDVDTGVPEFRMVRP